MYRILSPGAAAVPETVAPPDLSLRPLRLATERAMAAPPHVIYAAWTEGIDRWFALPGSVLMEPEVNRPFFFETWFAGERRPHYGRFLRLDPHRLIEHTWLTLGTAGAETVVTVELRPEGGGTHLSLAHAGFAGLGARDAHAAGWEMVLALLDEATAAHHPAHAITLVRTIDAPPGDLYAAWTDPALMRRWMGQTVDADVRIGGRYRIEHRVGFVHRGEYRVLEPGRRLVQTFRAGRAETMHEEPTPFLDEVIEARFREIGPSRTELTFVDRWDGAELDESGRAAAAEAWSGWLDALETLFIPRTGGPS